MKWFGTKLSLNFKVLHSEYLTNKNKIKLIKWILTKKRACHNRCVDFKVLETLGGFFVWISDS